ncbi:MAG TPA: ribosome maturation factor RimM [Bacteroidota bacterium]
MIAIGQIAKSNGVRGAVGVRLLTDDAKRFAKLKAVWVGRAEDTLKRFAVESVRVQRSGVVLKLQQVDDRTAADELREQFVFVEESDAVVPKKGSYFIHDIIGMDVETEEGEAVGVVKDVWRLPANDVWVVQRNGKETLVPAVKEFIRRVDAEQRKIVIHAVEGLIE